MRIGIDASRANIPDKTGTELYAFSVIQELKSRIPSDVRVELYSKEPLRGELGQLPDNWTSYVLRWPLPLLWTQARLALHILLRRPDVLYIPTHTLPLFTGKRNVAVIHDVGFAHEDELYDDKTIGGGPSWKKRSLNGLIRLATGGKYSAREQDYHRFAVEHAKKHADSIITVSQFSAGEIEQYYAITQEKITVIPNGYTPKKAAATPGEGHYLLYVGRVERKKNSAFLVDAYARARENGYEGNLVLAGKPGFGYNDVLARIARHSLQDSVNLLGYVDDDALAQLYAGADAFVFPSVYEGFGIPVLEAMDAATPVICSDIPALREVAGEGALFFELGNTRAAADAILEVTHNPSKRNALIELGQERIKEYSWEKTAQQTWDLLEKELKKSAKMLS